MARAVPIDGYDANPAESMICEFQQDPDGFGTQH